MRLRRISLCRGVTLIDTLVASALVLISFVGIAAAFQLSLDVVTNNKARAGAIALADERMEYVRSLAYDAIGTLGGVPSGTILQSETVSLNNISYTRRTFIEYEDDAADGKGASDTNGVVEDDKSVKVDVSWTSRSGVRHITLVTRVTPTAGLESAVIGGTLTLVAINAAGTPLQGAVVSITNPLVTPAINITTFTDASGTVSILGAPQSTGYKISVTEPGYSTAQTYSVTGQNTNPNPGNLTVLNNKTTTGTFGVDVLGSKTIKTWTQIQNGRWDDSFADTSNIATSSDISVSGGGAVLAGGAPYPSRGEVQSVVIAPANIASWTSFTFSNTVPANSAVVYHVYDATGSMLIPEVQLSGNAAGFTTSPINLETVSTTTYPSLRLDAVLTTTATTSIPIISDWGVAYTYGPQPVLNIPFLLVGAKTIGAGPSGTIYKYDNTLSTGATGSIVIPNLEWDTYSTTVPSSTGYDVASACNPQPEALAPGASVITNLFLTTHSTNSLLVDVRSSATGNLIPNALITLTRSGFTATSTTDQCGQSYFGNLSQSAAYSISVTAAGQSNYTTSGISVSGTSKTSVVMN